MPARHRAVIAHLAEVEERRLHLLAACSSMFVYCTERLGMSEDEACRRIEAARMARRYPLAYRLLDSGELSLTVLSLLKDVLTAENHAELMVGVSRKSVRQAREWLAVRFPRPDVPSLIRKLPEQRELAPAPDAGRATAPLEAAPSSAAAPARPVAPAAAPAPAPVRARVEPLSEARYKIQFTASRELKEKIELARDLMSHAAAGGDLSVVFERALDLLVRELEKTRFGVTARPRRAREANPDRVANETRRVVVERDGLSCTYVDDRGHRCGARALLQHHHVHARGRGGRSGHENIRLLCAAHNRLEAEREYGREHVERRIAEQKARGRRDAPRASAPARVATHRAMSDRQNRKAGDPLGERTYDRQAVGVRVFVYGSLRRGEENHRFLERARFVGEGRTAAAFTLVDLGDFPALIAGGDTAIVGEIYEVDAATLARLDRLEGHPRLYVRRPIALEDGSDVDAYVLAQGRRRGMSVVESGDWCKVRRER